MKKAGWRRRLRPGGSPSGPVAAFLATALPVVAMRWMDPCVRRLRAGRRTRCGPGRQAERPGTDYRRADLERDIAACAAVKAVIAAEDQ